MSDSIRKPRVVQVVQATESTLHHENRCTAGRFSELVQWCTPNLYCKHSREERQRGTTCSVNSKNEIRLHRRTTSGGSRSPTAVIPVHPKKRRLNRVHHNSEVKR